MADDEGPERNLRHLETCEACRQQVEARRAAVAGFHELVEGTPVPARLGATVESALSRADRVGGSTTLRDGLAAINPWPRRLLASAVATAAVVVAIWAVLPRLGAPTSLSAAEVIGRSVQAMSSASGVERLEYHLRVQGIRAPLLTSTTDLAFVVKQTVDHDRGRFLVARYDADGALVGAIAEDPEAGIRTLAIRMNGRRCLVRFMLPPPPRLSLPEFVRTAVKTWFGIVQASGAQNLSLVTADGGRRFVVRLPEAAVAREGAWSLEAARIVVDAADYHLVELDAKGHLLGSPYHVSFRLQHREVGGTASEADFHLPTEPGDLVLDGPASDNPIWDLAAAAIQHLQKRLPE